MKLIIDIPEDVYTRLFDNGVQDNEISVNDLCEIAGALRLGTPLDNVKAEIEAREMIEINMEKHIYNMALHDVLDILDNIGKAESEE